MWVIRVQEGYTDYYDEQIDDEHGCCLLCIDAEYECLCYDCKCTKCSWYTPDYGGYNGGGSCDLADEFRYATPSR